MARPKLTKGAKLERIERNLLKPENALRVIGAAMVAESRQAFIDQKWGDKKWLPRGPVNVMGIIADFAEGKKAPPERRFQKRPALIDTGRLRDSIRFQVSGNRVSVGTTLPYAQTMHAGGKVESKPITRKIQEALGKWLKGQSKPIKRKLGFLLNKDQVGETVESKVPARPFVGITRYTRKNVRAAIAEKMIEAK